MTTLKLTTEESAASGFTHKFVVLYTDLVALGAVTSGTVTLMAYTAGFYFRTAAFKLATAFDGGATSALTLDVGWDGATTDDDDGLINGIEIHVDSTEVLYQDGNGAAFATLRTAYPALDAGSIKATFAATGGNFDALTAGELHIYVGVVDLTKL